MSEPMQVWVEVWPVAADSVGIWLVSGDDAWRPALPVMADSAPHWEVESELRSHKVLDDAILLHSTSWRNGVSVILTYVAILKSPNDGFVKDRWPNALPVSPTMAEAVGKPATHGPTESPIPRDVDVLLHAMRHLLLLQQWDGTVRAVMDDNWIRHLAAFEPALAGMYIERHKPDRDDDRDDDPSL
jgi:hypothetical protein